MPVASLSHWVTQFVADHSIYAVFALMLVDAVFPAASELVMVYAGAVASGAIPGQHVAVFGGTVSGHLSAYLVMSLAGTLGYLAGALIGWTVGAAVGRPVIERHARAFHLDEARLVRMDRWFERYGRLTVLLGRITPVVRSFVSIPAGFERMPLAPYTTLTLVGSAVWAFGLAAVGWAIGASYARFHHAFDLVSVAIVAAIILGAAGLAVPRRGSGSSARN